MSEGHGEGVVAPVVDDDIAFGSMVEVHEGGCPLVLVVEQVEVDRDAVIEPVECADHALGVVGAVAHTIAVLCEFPGQGDLRAVDGESPVTLPQRALGTVGEDLRVQALERGLVELLPRLAGRRCRWRLRLRQLDACGLAMLPEFAERGPVALPARRGNEAEHEQHDQQAVEDPPTFLPARVLAFRNRNGGRNKRLPALREPPVGDGGPSPFSTRRRLLPRRAALRAQDLASTPLKRQYVDPFARLAPARGITDALPVGRTVARGLEPGLVDEGLDEDGTPAVKTLPVVGEAARRHGQGRGRKVLRDDPGKHQVP